MRPICLFAAALAVVVSGGGMAVLLATPAAAGSVTLDFGTLGADGGAACTGDCVIAGATAHDFTQSGVTVAATGYSSASASALSGTAYLTQKPGPFGSETGLGESNLLSPPSLDYEIGPGTAVVLDNSAAIALGYTPTSISIGSLQNGESADIFGGVTALATQIGTVTGPPVTQTIDLSASDRFVTVEGVTNNVVIVAETFAGPSQPVPEPASLAVFGTGLLALSMLRRRRLA